MTSLYRDAADLRSEIRETLAMALRAASGPEAAGTTSDLPWTHAALAAQLGAGRDHGWDELAATVRVPMRSLRHPSITDGLGKLLVVLRLGGPFRTGDGGALRSTVERAEQLLDVVLGRAEAVVSVSEALQYHEFYHGSGGLLWALRIAECTPNLSIRERVERQQTELLARWIEAGVEDEAPIGLAHGVAGVLYARSLSQSGTEEAAVLGAAARKLTALELRRPTSDSLCRGRAGIAVALVAAGRRTRSPETVQDGADLLTATAATGSTAPAVGLCHGLGGLVLASALLYRVTGEAWDRARLIDVAAELTSAWKRSERDAEPEHSLMHGRSGAALALSAALAALQSGGSDQATGGQVDAGASPVV